MEGSELQRCAAERAEELPAAELDHPFGPEIDVYRVRERMFMFFSDAPGAPVVVLKARPEDALALRAEYDDVTPGYHMNKKHWITLNPGGGLTRDDVEELVTESYLLVVEKLPRARRPVDPATYGRRG